MDFFSHQDAARSQTRRLAFLFAVAVVVFVGVTSLALSAILVTYSDSHFTTHALHRTYPALGILSGRGLSIFLAVASLMLLLIAVGSLYKISSLGGGGSAVALSLGGVPVNAHTADFQQRQLLNVVEEMAIASGIPVPSVYLLEDDAGINAFAAGYSSADAVIGITRGSLTQLSRDELQGVIAHEFSHILNGDMRLNIRAIGILHGILLIFIVGRITMRFASDGSRRSSKDSRGDPRGVAIAIGLVLIVFGYVGLLCARLIKSAISRQREFLADASAVQFTRNPAGIAGALRKILDGTGSKIASPRAEEASHMFFADGLAAAWLSLFQTHPPLRERIRRIDSSKLEGAGSVAESIHVADETQAVSLLNSSGRAQAIVPRALADVLGKIDISHIEQARGLISTLGPDILAAAREPYSARALIFLLLFSQQEVRRIRQRELLRSSVSSDLYELTVELERRLPQVGVALRLPLIDLVFPALRQLSASQHESFKNTVRQLIFADNHVSFFEYILQRIVFKVGPNGGTTRAASTRVAACSDSDVTAVLVMLAVIGQREDSQISAAVRAGATQISSLKNSRLIFSKELVPNTERLDRALDNLEQLTPALKQEIMLGCMAVILEDRTFTIQEYELLRAIGSALECPIPISLPL